MLLLNYNEQCHGKAVSTVCFEPSCGSGVHLIMYVERHNTGPRNQNKGIKYKKCIKSEKTKQHTHTQQQQQQQQQPS